MKEPFTFGIPLIARASARDWALVETLLDLTLSSLAGQMDQDFRILIACHDRPAIHRLTDRIDVLVVDWPAAPVRSDNLDAGRKKHAINARVLASGGGLLMFLDADDWIDTRLVETARAGIGSACIGGVIETGFAVDFRRSLVAPLPHPGLFEDGFHKLCGSSTIGRLRPGDPEPIRRDPHATLHEHYRWIEGAKAHGVALARLDIVGAYVINTSENHSERHGPYAAWRQTFARSVSAEGRPLDAAFASRFGLDHDAYRAAAARLHQDSVGL